MFHNIILNTENLLNPKRLKSNPQSQNAVHLKVSAPLMGQNQFNSNSGTGAGIGIEKSETKWIERFWIELDKKELSIWYCCDGAKDILQTLESTVPGRVGSVTNSASRGVQK